MAIKTQTVNGRPERLVVIACCTDKAALAQIAARWTANALPSRWANVVVGWCVDHFKKYRRAPGRELGALYDEWRDKADPETAEIVGKFLSELSDEHARGDRPATEHAVDTAARLMLRVQVVEAVARAQLALENGEVDRASEEFQNFKPLQLGSRGWVDLSDTETVASLIAAARASRQTPLIEYDGALDYLLGGVMKRGAFVAFAGTEKGTKSWWLQDTACRAYEQGRNVAYFEAGDSTREEVLDRLAVRLARRPYPNPLMPAVIRVPYEITVDGGGRKGSRARVQSHKIKPTLLTDERAAEALAGTGTGRLRVCAYPSGTLTVSDIETQLEDWRNEGFGVDLVVLDYADLLAPLNSRAEPRDQINANWRALRGISQKYAALVVTATQVKREAYDAWVIRKEHMADDKRKLAEVTAMIGINRTAHEIRDQVWRLNLVVGRSVHLPDDQCVYTAGCLWIGSPGEVSTF